MSNTESNTVNGQATILDRIVAKKKQEIEADRRRTPIVRLEESDNFFRECYSFRDSILDPALTGIIAEFKRQSPSKGIINNKVSVKEVTNGYASAGASALSVLTDRSFFGGKKADVIEARKRNKIPVLRKEFMLDEYQVVEAKALGADVILLIAAILRPDEIQKLARLAKGLGMSVLLEVHNREELDRSLFPELDAVGVNNRNLADFNVSVQHSYDLVEHIPAEFLKISESGLSDPTTITELRSAGFNGFLIGENFMKQQDPGRAMAEFVKQF
ncbi:indole-3-glycerol phosphate synthase TrpC [Daejeonella lutea]|uniref:Indole-3-glycerol phosphate synthase n=1 Tax=Daejeonella lutea TaxID=572036 RepID=A0A1T5D944_9SPHI|nr:indole-3-glycerol phosphate synthase TrpC [Daejeonella lutea]SKB68136.1 indole-3-glycerol phosphate synthase [Daejeonella lutea]